MKNNFKRKNPTGLPRFPCFPLVAVAQANVGQRGELGVLSNEPKNEATTRGMKATKETQADDRRGGERSGGGRLANQLLSRHRYLRRQPATAAAATATSHPESQTRASFKYVDVGTKNLL